MNEIIYLESSEEITSVIDRLKANPAGLVTFVIPRGASIAQSIVNLKLLKKSAEEVGKEISLVATDRISRNLASQIGITVYSKVSEAQRAKPALSKNELDKETLDADDQSGFKVNNYYRNKESELHGSDSRIDTDDTSADTGKPEDPEETKEEDKPETAEHHSNIGMTRRPLHEQHHREESRDEIKPKIQQTHPRPTNLKGSRKPLIAVLSILAVVIIIVSFIFLPYASAKILVKTEDFSSEANITIDKSATAKDESKLVVPGKLIEAEKETTKSFDATGTKDAGEKASGKLKVYNSLDTSAHNIPSGTKFTSSGKSFLSQADVTVPAATPTLVNGTPGVSPGISGEVSVTAEAAGDSYNVAAGDFAISGLSSKITGKSTSAMSGGVTKVIKVVTDADISKAEQAVKDDLSSNINTDLEDAAKKEKLSIFENSSKNEVISSQTPVKSGDETDKFDYTVKLKFFALGFSRSDLDEILVKASEKELGEGKMILNPDKAKLSYEVAENNVDNGTMKIAGKLEGKSSQKISETDIRKQIKGKSEGKAKQIISANQNVEGVEIKAWPKFLGRIPLLVKRIKVSFDYTN